METDTVMRGMQNDNEEEIARQQVLANSLIHDQNLVIDPVAGDGDCFFCGNCKKY